MAGEWMEQFLAADLGLTALVSGLALAAVWVPLYRGLRLGMQAMGATRSVERAELLGSQGRRRRRRVEPMAVRMAKVLDRSLRETRPDACPSAFVVDAAKQYTVNEYDAHYARPLSMYANLLPPIGFIGTTGGLLILLVSRHLNNGDLELGALALALTSSIFALMGFALLEGLKIRLYGRLLACLDQAASLPLAPRVEEPRAV